MHFAVNFPDADKWLPIRSDIDIDFSKTSFLLTLRPNWQRKNSRYEQYFTAFWNVLNHRLNFPCNCTFSALSIMYKPNCYL